MKTLVHFSESMLSMTSDVMLHVLMTVPTANTSPSMRCLHVSNGADVSKTSWSLMMVDTTTQLSLTTTNMTSKHGHSLNYTKKTE